MEEERKNKMVAPREHKRKRLAGPLFSLPSGEIEKEGEEMVVLVTE